ncbi:MAG: T9SS type A sorting domain-containing protein [Bacteroidetes bacterium]|nr:T9SS type A sorting domain-containing protein [Bacteroidota bacterium]
MKKLFTIFLLLSSFTFFAQTPPVIEGTYFPVRNTSIKQVWDTSFNSLTIPTTGPNQIWDYRIVNNQFTHIVDTFGFAILDPATTPYGQYFPTATQCAFIRTPYNNVSDSLYEYFRVDYDGLHNIGGFNIQNQYDSTIIHNPTEFYAPPSMSYLFTKTDTSRYIGFAKNFNYLGFKGKIKGRKIKTFTYCGYGTLRLPNGDYNNVALVKETYAILDSIFIDFTNTNNYTFATIQTASGHIYEFFRNNTFGSAYLAYLAANPANTGVAYAWYTLPVNIGSLSGNVYTDAAETTPVTNGEMYLYRENSNFKKNDILARAQINALGQYKFDSIPYGEYRITCRPDNILYPNANTTYFGDTTNWIDATAIITTTTTSPGHKIHLQYHPAPVGSNVIEGTLGQDNTIFRTSGPNFSNPIPSIGIVVKKNPGSSAARMGVTNSNGTFSISALDDGNYTLFVDIPGLHHAGSYNFNVSGGTVINGLDFTAGTDSIHPTNATVGIKELKRSSTGFMTAYPNPYTTLSTIAVNLPSSSKILLEVYDVLGKKIQTLDNSEKQQGVHKYNFSAKSLNYSSGMYFVKLTIGNTTDVIKIVEQ